MFQEQITVAITTNGMYSSDSYILSQYVPKKGVRLFTLYYGYFQVVNAAGKGLVFRVLNAANANVVDFKVCDLDSVMNLDVTNVKYFMQGEYHRKDKKFKNVKTGAEFNEKLTDFSFDTALARKILEFIWLLYNKEQFTIRG